MDDLYGLMNKMDQINYGWLDIYDRIHINTIVNIEKLYRTSSIDEILKYKVGICFDQVELERDILNGIYNTKSYAIISSHIIHTFLVLEKNNQYIYFEHSSYENRGIYYFYCLEELLQYTIKSFLKTHHIKNLSKLTQIEYPKIQPNTTFEEIKQIMLSIVKEKKKTK